MTTSDWVDFLQTPAAQVALEELAAAPVPEGETLRAIDRLRRHFTSQQAAALMTQARLRTRAATKFPRAASMYFDEAALEQATAWPVALHRAEQLHSLAPPGPLLDLGCGIGGDLLALAHFRPVQAWELDPQRARVAQANVDALRPPHPVTFHVGDWTAALDRGELQGGAAFVDPSRRTVQRRLFTLEALEPPFSTILRLREFVPALAMKGPPGVDLGQLPHDCAVEFVSHEGVCKEAVLWFAAPSGPVRWASIYDGSQWHSIVAVNDPAPQGTLEPGMTLYEPDPAVLRAGALTPLCAHLDAHLFDPQIGYLVASTARATPFATAFRIRELFPFSLRRINERLAALGAGTIEIKKRGFPQEPETLRPRLRLTPGGAPIVLFLTRRRDQHWALLADRLLESGL